MHGLGSMCWVLWMFYVKGSHLGARSRIACPSNLFLFEPLHLTNQSLAGQVCAMFHVDSSNPPPHSKPLQTLSISGDTAPNSTAASTKRPRTEARTPEARAHGAGSRWFWPPQAGKERKERPKQGRSKPKSTTTTILGSNRQAFGS